MNANMPNISASFFFHDFICSIAVCGSRWTQWLNRDGPGGDGDEETLPLLQSEFPQLLCKNPVAVEARLSDGR